MKISLNWLKEYIPIKVSPQRLAEKLTMAGLEVEKIATGAVGGDTQFELEITPNRPDCLNYLGIAREISAIFNSNPKLPKVKAFKFPKQKTDITIEDPKSCPRYIGTLIENVNIAPSPNWLKRHLESIGSRAINNIVDITNFCLFETGQSLHAFDFDKLQGGKIIVRRAKPGESIVTLDSVERKLDPSILVIADAKRPVAIAGIMGGKETEVRETTKNILLESAYFDPGVIRRGARLLGLSSDSSYRFERGVNTLGIETAGRRAASLILEWADGSLAAHRDLFVSKQKSAKKEIFLSIEEINSRLGSSLTIKKCRAVLEKLGCKIVVIDLYTTNDKKNQKAKVEILTTTKIGKEKVSKNKNVLKIIPPDFRNDFKTNVDAIEEIARIVGYDQLPSSLPSIRISSMAENPKRAFKQNLSRILQAQGFNEAITYTMMDRKALSKTKLDFLKVLEIKNPLSSEQEILRPSLLPSFLSTVQLNLNRGQKDLRLFEIGKEYSLEGEKEILALCTTGAQSADWRKPKQDVNFYDLKGVIESLVLDQKEIVFKPAQHPVFKSVQCAEILVEEKVLGVLGLISDDVLKQWDIKHKNIYLAELNLELFFKLQPTTLRYHSIPEYPVIGRDISLAVKQGIPFQEIRQIISRHGTEHLTSIKFLEQYLGDKIPQGCRGMVVSLTFQSSQRTLREEEVNQIYEKISQALSDELGAVRR